MTEVYEAVLFAYAQCLCRSTVCCQPSPESSTSGRLQFERLAIVHEV